MRKTAQVTMTFWNHQIPLTLRKQELQERFLCCSFVVDIAECRVVLLAYLCVAIPTAAYCICILNDAPEQALLAA